MKIIEINADTCLGWILAYPELAEKSFSMRNPRFEETKSKYIAIVSDDDVYVMVKYEWFCEYGVQIHPYINPKYWKTSVLPEGYKLLAEYFEKRGAKSLIAMCPEDAVHAIKAAKKVEFKEVGHIDCAVNWKGNINKMVILQRVL